MAEQKQVATEDNQDASFERQRVMKQMLYVFRVAGRFMLSQKSPMTTSVV